MADCIRHYLCERRSATPICHATQEGHPPVSRKYVTLCAHDLITYAVSKEASAIPEWYKFLKENSQRFETRDYDCLVNLGLSFVFDADLWAIYADRINKTLVSPPTSAAEQRRLMEKIWQDNDQVRLSVNCSGACVVMVSVEQERPLPINAPEFEHYQRDVVHHSHLWRSGPGAIFCCVSPLRSALHCR